MFTPDDARVFATVKDNRKRRRSLEDAYLALKSGERGEIPVTQSEIDTIAPNALIVALRDKVTAIEQALLNVTLERERAVTRAEIAEKTVADLRAELRELYKELGRMEATHNIKP
jgi:hypothetical protein